MIKLTIEPIGVFTILVSFGCFLFGPSVSMAVFMSFTLLGAAAAAFLTALGGANIQPAHLLLVFILMDLLLRPGLQHEALGALRFPRAGFWLLLTVGYGAAVTIIMPRLFAGAVYVFSPARSDSGAVSIVSVPLAPSGANITQTLYFISDALCFVVFYSYAQRRSAVEDVVRAVIVCAAINLFFVVVDLATYYTGTADILSFMRNSTYRMLDDSEMAGLKRIVGSFTEASSFAYTTLALLAFTLRLWSEGIAPRRTGPLALLSALAVLFATSSAGYVGLAALLGLQVLSGIRRLLRGRAAPNTVILLGLAPICLAVIVACVFLVPQFRIGVAELLDATIFNKMSSDSGIERGAWNRQAFVVTQGTMWLGAGIGSLRASSWLIAIPANIGAIGTAGYACFLLAVLFGSHRNDTPSARSVRAAARDACFVQLVCATVAGAFIDLGLSFFLFAAVASARLPGASDGSQVDGASRRAAGRIPVRRLPRRPALIPLRYAPETKA